nr:hypothetical protein [Tanacetum cinerariifolium]
MGYHFYFPPENKLIVARYGDFLERDLISQKFSRRDYDMEDDHMDTLPSENTSEIPVEPESLGPPSEVIHVRGEPANYKTVMLDPDKVTWQGAMDEEMKSMKVNKVWIVVDRPPNTKVVRNKWLYKKKTDMDGKTGPGKPISEHVLEMKGLIDQLHTLGKPYDNDMAVNLINRSLNKDFGDFVRNFNMHCVGKTITGLHALLIDFEKGLKDEAPTPQVFTIQKGRDNKPKPQANKKVKGKGKADKNKQVVPYQPKPKPNPLKRKENPNKDQACHHCHVVGHWKRNCPLYLEELRANKKMSEPVLQFQGFKEERKLSYGVQYLQVGNGTQAA